MADVLRLEGVRLEDAEGRPILRHLTATLPARTRVRLESVSGGGATALLRLCAGLAHPSEGQVILGDAPLEPYAFRHPFLSHGLVGWVPTEGGLLANQSLRMNLALPLRFLRGLRRAEAEAQADATLADAGLGSLAGLRPHGLDPKERWLGALARTAALGPALWLVDRPPAELDPMEAATAQRMLLEGQGGEAAGLFALGPALPDVGTHTWRLAEGRLADGGPR
jgi:ABC-type ATPase involved in cell division